ncbi:MAG: PAS domain S-box protein [Candidatus Sericytochromatia bacterium]|nr:PAS domain S-box protein [Candidatus Sericytochromatia bacterium]
MSAEHESGLSFLFDTAYRYQPDFNRYVSNYVALLKLDNPFMDDTQMNLAQQTLQIEFYKQCLESLGIASFDCLVILDYNGLLLEINTMAERALAVKRSDVLGQPFFNQIFPGHQAEENVTWIKEHAKADIPLHRKSTEMTMIKSNGTMFPAEIKVTELQVFGSALLVICFNDITRRKWMDQALKYTEERYRKIMGENADAIFLLDPFNKRIEESNPAFHIMMGYSADELFALRLYDVMEGEPEDLDAWVDKRLNQGTSLLFREHGRFRNRSQHLIDVEFTTSVFDLRDHPVLCVIARDTVPRDLVVRRSLADQQISSLQKKVEKLGERLNELSQTMLNKAQNEILIEIKEYHQNLAQELEKDSSNKDPLPVERNPRPFELKAAIYQVQSFFKTKLEAKNLPLLISVEPDVPDILIGDALYLQEILFHLLENAVSHTQEGNILLKVRLSKTEGTQTTVLFTLRDSGAGMDTVTKAKMTDVVNDDDPLATGKKYGVRGVSICSHLIKALDGKLWFNTIEGKGSSFLFSLPMETTQKEPEDLPELTQEMVWQHLQLVDDALAEMESIPESEGFTLIEQETAPGQAAEQQTTTTGPLRLLLVEHNVDHALEIQRCIGGQNVEMRMVDNGRKALELVQEQDFDLILMGLDLPIMNGEAAGIAIREWERSQRREPLLMVAFGSEAPAEESQQDFMRFEQAPLDEATLNTLLEWARQQLPQVATPVIEAISELDDVPEPGLPPVEAAAVPQTEPDEEDNDTDDDAVVVELNADMAKLAPDFLAKRRKDLNKIQQALAENKLDSVRVLGKSMKGTGAVYGFDALADIGRELEEAASNNDAAGVQEWAHVLTAFLERVKIVVV